jgi:hypothetical protein
MNLRHILAILTVCTTLPASAEEAAQQPPAAKPAAAPPASPAIKWGKVNVTGSFRTRLEMWDWMEGSANNAYAFSGNIFKLSLASKFSSGDWQLELAAPFLLGMPNNATAAAPQGPLGLGAVYSNGNDRRRNAAMVFPKQGWVRFNGMLGSAGNSLKLGRFEFRDGAEITKKHAALNVITQTRIADRLIGAFPWTHVGRSFDGFHFASAQKNATVTVTGFMPTRGAFQVDGWGNMKMGVGYASVAGASSHGRNHNDWRVLGMYYQDWRHVLKTDNRAAAARIADMANIRIATIGGHYSHLTETDNGALDFMVWGVVQTGKWGRLDHEAYAADIEGGWQPKFAPKLRPWIRAGFTHGSGDSDANDRRHGTFMQMLPTPRPFARFPFYNMMNNQDAFGMVTLRPHKDFTVKVEGHSLRLANRNDVWYQGGGAFQPWSFGYVGRATGGARGLATYYDVSGDWNVRPNVTLSGFYGYAIGKSAMARIYPQGKDGAFGYLEMMYRF